MRLVTLDSIFDITYGNQFDFVKLEKKNDGYNFVSRSSKNLGITGKVATYKDISPFDKGLITVTLGGTYLLSAFVQPHSFYTAQNVKVLKPKLEMSYNEKVYYCSCISLNRFKYSSHGREANRSLEKLLVPAYDEVPEFVRTMNKKDFLPDLEEIKPIKSPYVSRNSKTCRLKDLFTIENGISLGADFRSKEKVNEEYVPYVRPSKTQGTSYVEYVNSNKVDEAHIREKGSLYVSTNGQGSHTFAYVSAFKFIGNSDVSILIPKRKMGLREKLYYAKVISVNRPLYSYGRKPKGTRLGIMEVPETAPPFVFESEVL